MTYAQIEGIAIGFLFWIVISSMIYVIQSEKEELSFSYTTNYYYWKSLNWIGVIFFTICLKITLLPAYIIWLIHKLFTFGRKG